LSVAGCAPQYAKYRPELPDEIGGKGLVVGEVHGIGSLSGFNHYVDVNIDGGRKGAVAKGLIAIPMSEGEHSLDSLFQKTFAGSTLSGSVRITTYNTQTLPIKRAFTVRAGKVTDLGLLVLYPDPGDKEKKHFLKMFVDDREDMKRLLKNAYPALAAKLDVDGMTLAPGQLMPDNLLQALRKDLAKSEMVRTQGYPNFVAASVGTAAQVVRDKDGRAVDVKLIDMPTVASVRSSSPNFVADRMAILMNNERLFVVKDGRAVERTAPRGLRAGTVYALGARDLAIVDDRMEIYTSADEGKTWNAFTEMTTEKETATKIVPAPDGFYVYGAKPPTVLHVAAGSRPTPVDVPAMKYLGQFSARPFGLYAEEGAAARQFHFRGARADAWETRAYPAPNCRHINFTDKEGANVSIICSRMTYVSSDGGRAWTRKSAAVADARADAQ
jgi:hypothetical protein